MTDRLAAADADFAALVSSLDGFSKGGITVAVTELEAVVGPGSLQVRGDLMENDVKVGDFTRVLIVHNDGRRRANHMRMELDPEARGGPFGDAFRIESEGLYKRYEIGEIKLSAEQVGSYLWAKHGFMFAGAEGYKLAKIAEFAARADELLPVALANGLPKAKAAAIQARLAAPRVVTPLEPPEIAQFGSAHPWAENGRQVWLGKLTLVDGEWEGYKLL